MTAAWPSGQRVGLAIPRSRVRVTLWPLAGFVLGRPVLKSSATLIDSQLGASCQLEFLILLCCIWIILSAGLMAKSRMGSCQKAIPGLPKASALKRG